MAKIHVCLVSEQAIPNITPALDPEFRPDSIILLVSADMEQRVGWLEEVLRPTGVKLLRWEIDDPWDIERMRFRTWELLEKHQDNNIALNATGGTKPMSIAAYEAFRGFEKPIYYVHPELDRIIWLYPGQRSSHELANRIRLKEFLLAHGTRITKRGATIKFPSAYRELTEQLITNIEEYSIPLRALNWLAQRAKNKLRSPPLGTEKRQRSELVELLQIFEDADVFLQRKGKLIFPNENARFFANGGWLENHVYSLIRELRKDIPTIQDYAQSIDVKRSVNNREIKNELDAALLNHNRLFIVECKTRKFSVKATEMLSSKENTPGAEALYKLDTLKDLMGGLKAKAMLISYQPLSPWDKQRAEDLRINTCCGTELRQLRRRLHYWIS